MVKLENTFPSGIRIIKSKEDKNPAVQLFGRRFFGDQPTMEILSEMLLLMTSTKLFGVKSVDTIFPDISCLQDFSEKEGEALFYQPKAKLNLKLFAFLGASRLETRHESHRKHCEELWRDLRNKINTTEDMDKDDALRILSNLFLGFWGNGAERTWCAQTFLPFCRSVLTTETIWNESEARRQPNSASWDFVVEQFNDFFSVNKHRFLARGGEMLYLHLCNALLQKQETLQAWFSKHQTGDQSLEDLLTGNEKSPIQLHASLQAGFERFFSKTPKVLDQLASFIDTGVDNATAKSSDGSLDGSPRKAECGWCPIESWREGYLFAVELNRILESNIDVIEAVDLLEIACGMHVMRSLAAQSYRATVTSESAGFEYRILVSDEEGNNRRIKELSRLSLNQVSRQIYTAIRIPEIKNTLDQNNLDKIYKDSDDRYGRKLYLHLGKSLGLIVPRRGAGVRVVLTDRLLRYLLLSLVPVQRMTLDTFKRQIELHHGLVFEESALRADRNLGAHKELLDSSEHADSHLEQMLDAAGVLVRLSDSCSLVRNPFL
jgi:hypothetical protein